MRRRVVKLEPKSSENSSIPRSSAHSRPRLSDSFRGPLPRDYDAGSNQAPGEAAKELDVSLGHRPTDVPDTGLICDLLWADPDKEQDSMELAFEGLNGSRISLAGPRTTVGCPSFLVQMW